MRRTPLVVLMVGLLMLGGTATAGAAPPPAEPTPTQCLDAFDDTGDDYVGDGWVGALVASHTNDWFTHLWDDTDREYNLFCGDELSGVVHAAHEEGSGHGHPITPDNEADFLHCWQATIGGGEVVPDPRTARRQWFVLEFRPDEYAIAIVDTERKFTYTLYTEGGMTSNNWHDCYVVLN
jgi:hypothetical protein